MGNTYLSVPMLTKVAQRFKILSEPIRLQLINQLQVNHELSVSELVEATGHSQANVSKHLTLMAREGILSRRKDGLLAYYSISDPTINELCTLVCGRILEEASENQKLLQE